MGGRKGSSFPCVLLRLGSDMLMASFPPRIAAIGLPLSSALLELNVLLIFSTIPIDVGLVGGGSVISIVGLVVVIGTRIGTGMIVISVASNSGINGLCVLCRVAAAENTCGLEGDAVDLGAVTAELGGTVAGALVV